MALEILTDEELAAVIGGVSTTGGIGSDAYRTVKDYANGGCGCGGGH